MATLTIVALFAGVSVTAAGASVEPTHSLRARVDAIGNRYFAAKEAARRLDDELRALDQKLALARRREKALHPVAKATAVQLYQGSAQGFSAWFDVADAMESARRAELIARAGDRTQAFLDEYMNAADRLAPGSGSRLRRPATSRPGSSPISRSSRRRSSACSRRPSRPTRPGWAQRRRRGVDQHELDRARIPSPWRPDPTPRPPPGSRGAAHRRQGGTNPHHNDPFLVCTRTRESAGDYTAVNLGGYYGAYQFSQPTWDVTANHAGSPQLIGVRPDPASPWDQDQLAWVLYQWQGNAPWGGLC